MAEKLLKLKCSGCTDENTIKDSDRATFDYKCPGCGDRVMLYVGTYPGEKPAKPAKSSAPAETPAPTE